MPDSLHSPLLPFRRMQSSSTLWRGFDAAFGCKGTVHAQINGGMESVARSATHNRRRSWVSTLPRAKTRPESPNGAAAPDAESDARAELLAIGIEGLDNILGGGLARNHLYIENRVLGFGLDLILVRSHLS